MVNIVKEWKVIYYDDPSTGMSFISPKEPERFVKKEIDVIMRHDERYCAFFKTESHGPIAMADTIDECEKKFMEMYHMSVAIKALMGLNDREIRKLATSSFEKYSDHVLQYKNGKVGLLGLFVGEVMKELKGKGDPKEVLRIVSEELNKI